MRVIFARIAQMESSPFVGGSAQTQALLRAPDLTSGRADGGVQRGRSHGAHAIPAPSSIPLPSGSIHSPVAAFKSLNLAQAMLDGLAVIFGLFFFAALLGSLPLAVALMILGVF